jgi:hypothetical protein
MKQVHIVIHDRQCSPIVIVGVVKILSAAIHLGSGFRGGGCISVYDWECSPINIGI